MKLKSDGGQPPRLAHFSISRGLRSSGAPRSISDQPLPNCSPRGKRRSSLSGAALDLRLVSEVPGPVLDRAWILLLLSETPESVLRIPFFMYVRPSRSMWVCASFRYSGSGCFKGDAEMPQNKNVGRRTFRLLGFNRFNVFLK